MVVDDEKWYTQRGGRLRGPYSRLTVHRYLLLGRIKNTDRVSKDGEVWEPITQVPQLIPEELLDLSSEHGWQHFIRARDLVDQRDELTVSISEEQENRIGEQNFLNRIRAEWNGMLQIKEDKSGKSNFIPMSLFWLTLSVVIVLIVISSSALP